MSGWRFAGFGIVSLFGGVIAYGVWIHGSASRSAVREE
jgi:hypothetical protein